MTPLVYAMFWYCIYTPGPDPNAGKPALKDQVAALTKANEALLKGETPAGSKPGQTGTGQDDKRTAWQKCQKPARK